MGLWPWDLGLDQGFGIRDLKSAKLLLATLLVTSCAPVASQSVASLPPCPDDATTIRAVRLFDGRGGAFANAVVAVRGDTIASVGACSGDVTHDLGDATLLPGFIDVHVHLDWHFGPDGRFGERPEAPTTTEAQRQAAIFENARMTLQAGFTTVQSLGSPVDVTLRDVIARGQAPGPRIITSAGQIQLESRTPDELRALVRTRRAAGADVIKVIAPEALTGSDARRQTEARLVAIVQLKPGRSGCGPSCMPRIRPPSTHPSRPAADRSNTARSPTMARCERWPRPASTSTRTSG